MRERLQKLLADQGLGSRREIESWINAGKIKVNGHVAGLGDKASLDDSIRLAGRNVSLRRDNTPCALMFNKPCGVLVTRSDRRDRRTVFSLLPPPRYGRWVAVGRLDINTSGLLIVCNDGGLAARLMHPSYGIEREYRVRVRGKPGARVLDNLKSGVMLERRLASFRSLHPCGGVTGANRWFRVVLSEGRNREVRRLWQSQGFSVSRLIRTRFGSVELDIPTGAYRALTAAEIESLYTAVKLSPPRQRPGKLPASVAL